MLTLNKHIVYCQVFCCGLQAHVRIALCRLLSLAGNFFIVNDRTVCQMQF